MAKRIMQFLSRILIVLFIIGFPISLCAQNSNTFRVSIDRAPVSGGDSVDVSVRYALSATKPHLVHSVTARFNYDSSLIHIVSLETNGTATSGFYILDTITPSVVGFLAAGSTGQEIDLTNPVLFRLRVKVNPRLSDTAWIQWDRSVTMFGDTSYGIDTVIMDDGWLNTPNSFGRTSISIPAIRVVGSSDGFSPDSVRFSIPILISNLSKANVRTANFRTAFDANRLSFLGASTGNIADGMISNVTSTVSTLSVDVSSVGQSIAGSDTLIVLHFAALVGTDTILSTLTNVSWRPTNSDGLLGNVYCQVDSLRFFGGWLSVVFAHSSESPGIQVFPNPVRKHLNFEMAAGSGSERLEFKVYNVQGKLIEQSSSLKDGWDIPAGVPKGVYEVEVGPFQSGIRLVRTLCVGP